MINKIKKGLVGYMWDGPNKPFARFIWKLKKKLGLRVHHSGIPIIVSDKVTKDKTAVYAPFSKFSESQKKLIEYAYICNVCCCILEMPCFVDGKCPECGSKSKEILYLKKKNDKKIS